MVYCVSRGDAGVVPYWSGDEEGDVHEGDVALPRTGSDEPVDMLGYSVVSTFGSGGRVAPVMRKVTFMRVMLPCPGPVPTSRSIELLVHPGQVAPLMRKVMFMRVMFPCPGPDPTSRSIVLLVQSAREAPVMRPGQWRMLPEMR